MIRKVLMYNLNPEKKRRLTIVCMKLKLRVMNVSKEQYAEPIGYLAGVSGMESCGQAYEGEGFSDEMLVFAGFDQRILDSFLREFSKNKIERVALKAMLTPYNAKWNSLQLYEEIKKEHEALH